MEISENLGMTAIPNALIDEHLKKAKFEYLAVYLHGARHRGEEQDLKKTAKALGLRELDVVTAWTYWENAGLVHISDGSLEGFAYSFINTAPEPEKAPEAPPVKPPKTAPAKAAPPPTPNPPPPAEDAMARPEQRPSYSITEIQRVSNTSDDVRYLFKMAEKLLGKPLTYNEMNLFLGFNDWLSLPVQVIEVLLDYCVSNNHKNGRYLEKVAIDWADNGITTVDEAEAYIKAFNTEYREIMKAFGNARRDPSPKEIAYMKKWLRELKMPLELITEACGRTVIQTGSARFTYADRIIESWYQSEVRTLEDAAAFDEEYKQGKAPGDAADKPRKPRQKSRFASYKGRDYDYDALEKLADDYVENSLNM